MVFKVEKPEYGENFVQQASLYTKMQSCTVVHSPKSEFYAGRYRGGDFQSEVLRPEPWPRVVLRPPLFSLILILYRNTDH